MGGTTSKTKKQFSICHQKFTSVKILNDQQMQIQIRSTLDDYNSWKSNLRKINSFNKQNILVPLNHSFQKQGWCSENTGIVKITYDNYQFIFQEELENRITLDKHLSEEEMWYLLYTLVSTAKDFSFLNKKVGDIRPHNIFVSQAGQIKLGVCFSWPNEVTNYQKTLNQKQITYVSPQQLQICKNEKLDNLINSITAESFSIGLTMLHAGLLFNFSSIYNIQKYQMNTKLLEQKIQNWMKLSFQNEQDIKTSYSAPLKQIIKNLCIIDPQKRQSSTQIYKLLQPFKQQILNIQPFQLKYGRMQNPLSRVTYNPHTQNIKQSTTTSQFQLYNNFMPISQSIPINVNPPQTQFTYIQPNDWINRPINNQITIKSDQHYQIFNKYAVNNNNMSIQQNMIPFSHNKLTTFQQNTSFKTPSSYLNTVDRVVSVKPFQHQNIQQTNKYSYPVQVDINRSNERITQNVQKITVRAPSNSTYSITPAKQFTSSIHKVQITKGQSQQDYSQFLRKIDEQIQKSRNLFPS